MAAFVLTNTPALVSAQHRLALASAYITSVLGKQNIDSKMSANWKMTVPLLALFLAVASASLVGGPTDADPNSQAVKDALQFAEVQYNAKTNSLYLYKATKVLKATTQVVSGILYTLEVEMSLTSCKKNGAETDCAVNETAEPKVCTFKVWSQPWLNKTTLTQHKCNP